MYAIGGIGDMLMYIDTQPFFAKHAINHILVPSNTGRRDERISHVLCLQSSVEKRSKDVYGASGGRKLLMFLDDMSMPHMDTYGTQQPIALLKLLLERKV